MLGDFIRLTDYVAVEALVNLTVRTNEMFLTELLKPRKAGLFETTVLFTDEGTAFAPTCEDIKVGCMGDKRLLSCTEIVTHRPSCPPGPLPYCAA